jgi:hypothetical protein
MQWNRALMHATLSDSNAPSRGRDWQSEFLYSTLSVARYHSKLVLQAFQRVIENE